MMADIKISPWWYRIPLWGVTRSHRGRFIQLNFVSPGIGGVGCFTWIGRSSAETPLAPAAGWMANCPGLPIKLCGSGRTNQPLGGLFRRHYLEAGEKAYRNDKTERPRKPCKHKASRVLLMVRLTGLEPVRRETHAPQTCLSTSSSTAA